MNNFDALYFEKQWMDHGVGVWVVSLREEEEKTNFSCVLICKIS